MEYLPDASDWFKKDLADKFEYDEDWETPDWNKRNLDTL
jgi:hypothetical protein